MAEMTVLPTVRRIQLTGIDPVGFQHPLDRQATVQLKKIQGFDSFTSKFLEFGFERIDYVLNIASYIRVGPRQSPRLYGLLQLACAVLDVPEPELYIAQGDVNAYTFGHRRPYIVLQTGLLDLMNDDELLGVLGHELGHIKCGHVLYKTMAALISAVGEVAGEISFGLGKLLTAPIEAGLTLWDRRSEFTADRAALLTLQDVTPAITLLMKLAGGTTNRNLELDPAVFLEQARAYGEETDQLLSSRLYRLVASLAKGTHPFTIERAKALNEWVDSAGFEQIMLGNFPRLGINSQGLCSRCGQPIRPGFRFCAGCGQPVAGGQPLAGGGQPVAGR